MVVDSNVINANSTLSQYGLAGLVILILAGVVVVLWHRMNTIQREKDALQDKRLEDAKEIQDRLTVFIQEQTTVSKQMYDLLLSINTKPRG